MREAAVERAFVDACKKAGFWAVKLPGVLQAGLPDRVVLRPGGRIAFVELKRPGGKCTELQLRTHERLLALGFEVHVIDNPAVARALVSEWVETDARGSDPEAGGAE